MFKFFDQVWKGMQMTEVMTLLKSDTGHSFVKSFTGEGLSPQPFNGTATPKPQALARRNTPALTH